MPREAELNKKMEIMTAKKKLIDESLVILNQFHGPEIFKSVENYFQRHS